MGWIFENHAWKCQLSAWRLKNLSWQRPAVMGWKLSKFMKPWQLKWQSRSTHHIYKHGMMRLHHVYKQDMMRFYTSYSFWFYSTACRSRLAQCRSDRCGMHRNFSDALARWKARNLPNSKLKEESKDLVQLLVKSKLVLRTLVVRFWTLKTYINECCLTVWQNPGITPMWTCRLGLFLFPSMGIWCTRKFLCVATA